MIIEVNNQDLELLYSKAKENYIICINHTENEFLKKEVNVSLNSVLLRETDIKIVFSQEIADMYQLEVCLTIYADNQAIGKYVYIENKRGEAIEDSLVFY
jgi:hypothetical protein